MTGEETCVIPDQISRLAILERKERKAGRQGFRGEFDAFLDTIEKKVLNKDQPLGKNEYRVHVTYTMPRSKKTLDREFSEDGVSHLFYGTNQWRNHSSCAKMDQTPGERIMLLKHFDSNTTSEENITEMGKLGYGPATHLEAHAFAKTNPKLQRKFCIIALGSSTERDGFRYVADVRNYSGKRILDERRFHDELDADDRFLFVRK